MQLALDLSLPADIGMLAATRKVLATYLQEFGALLVASGAGRAMLGIVDDVILALDEACSNVVQHAYPEGRDDNTYRLRANLQRERILIEVVDDGVGFDAMEKPRHPDDSDHVGPFAISGRGMEVMRRLMTTVEVESPTPTGGTRLRLVRLLPPLGE